MATKAFRVRSCNFSYHPAIEVDTFEQAIEAARKRGFDARIESADGRLVAVWSIIGGVKRY